MDLLGPPKPTCDSKLLYYSGTFCRVEWELNVISIFGKPVTLDEDATWP